MPIHSKSITYYLTHIHPSYKEAIITKIKLALSMNAVDQCLEVPTLEGAFLHYGKALYRVRLTEEINKLIMQAWGGCSALEHWASEVWELHELAKKSEALWKEMIGTILQKQSLEQTIPK